MCDFGAISGPALAAAAATTATGGLAAVAAPAAAAGGFSWLSAAGLAASVLGTAGSAFGQMQQSRYQAQVAKNNAQLAEYQAQDAERRGKIAEEQQRKKTGLILGTQRAALGGQGTALDEGSPLDIQGDTAAAGEMDALTIRSNAAREAWGYRAQASNYAAQARQAGGIGSYIGAGASLLGGAATVSDRWLRYNRAGLL